MSTLEKLEKLTPHLDSERPYGYTFSGISVYHVSCADGADLDLYRNLDETHNNHNDIKIGRDNPYRDLIVFNIAAHIEGNFGPPYEAIIVHRNDDGYVTIHTPKYDRWWILERYRELSNFLMGMRCLLSLCFTKDQP